MNFSKSPSLLNSPNYHEAIPAPLVPLNPSQFYKPSFLSNGYPLDIHIAVKKIKQSESCYRTLDRTNLQSNDLMNTFPQQKNLLLKNYFYNLNGFFHRSSNNIGILTSKSKELQSQIETSKQKLLFSDFAESPNSLFDTKASNNQITFDKTIFNKQFCNYKSNSNENFKTFQPLLSADLNRQMNFFLKPTKNQQDHEQTSKVLQPITQKINNNSRTKVWSKMICNKPFSRAAQNYIQEKSIKKFQNTLGKPETGSKRQVKEVKGNVTLHFSGSNFTLKIGTKKEN